MKRLITLAVMALCVQAAFGDSVSVTVSATGSAAYSDPINASGWLDRIEIVKSSDNDVVDVIVGTYSGTTVLEKFVNITSLATATDTVVIRPRAVGTLLTAGTALTAAATVYIGEITNAVSGTVLVAPYERMMIGGNCKLYVGASAGTNATVKATIYYEPLKK